MRTPAPVDDAGLHLPSPPDTVVDVYFGEQRVFSVAPGSFVKRNGQAHLRWPKVLRPFLDGRTQVVVREHLSGKVLVDQPFRTGTSDEPISVVDRQGRPLAIDKFNALVRMFDGTDRSTAHHLAEQVARLTADVNAFGVAGFVAYGSLLGAYRSGKLIGHDTDADTGYLSNYSQPADVARESMALERFLVDRGWDMRRERAGMIRAVFPDLASDTRHVDVFVGIHDGEHFYLDREVWAAIPRSAIVPLGTIELEGVEMPAPADVPAVLEATYGPTFATPDPAFKFDTPRSVRRRADAWVGNYRLNRAWWQRRFRSAEGQLLAARDGSGFARWVAAREPDRPLVVDVGCGLGADAAWFAKHGFSVVGVDYAQWVVRRLNRLAARRGLDARFVDASLYEMRPTVAAATRLAGEAGPRVLYSRNLLDVIENDARANFWMFVRTLLVHDGGKLYLQFRTHGDRVDREEPGFRQLDADRVVAEAEARGATVLHRTDRERRTRLVLGWS